ncbi:MAG TPA: hypothetical protein VH573_20145 [Mycobacteriales bacterium]
MTDPEETVPNSTTGSIADSDVDEPRHLAPDDAGERPLIDLSRDPTPGKPDHAASEDD